MAKKKRIVKTPISRQKVWLWQKLGWLAGFFGVSIALLTAVLYRQQFKPTEIFELTPVAWEVVKEWDFSTSDQVGEAAWNAYKTISKAQYKCGLTDVIVEDPNDCVYGGEHYQGTLIKSKGQKIVIPMAVAGGEAVVGSDRALDKATTLSHKNLALEIPAEIEKIRVKVEMKADFSAFLPWIKVTKNMAEISLQAFANNGLRAGQLTKTVMMDLGTNGEAVYEFEFDVSKYGAFRISGIEFKPVAVGQLLMKNLKINSIIVVKN